MIRAYRDLPLATDATNKFLPWTIGLMVFVATLALAATMLFGSVGSKWRAGVGAKLTVQVMPLPGNKSAGTVEVRTQRVLSLLRGTPGVRAADEIPRGRINELLKPWLGDAVESADLPLPRLIDVRLDDRDGIDRAALAKRIEKEAAGATLDDHGIWLDRLIAFAQGLEAVAIGVMVLISLASIATVVFTTRTGLAVHREVIELLHLIGARDQYIAREFQSQAMRLGLKGSVAGFVLAVATLVAISRLSQAVEASLLPALTLSATQWVILFCLPLAAILIGTMTARVTVLRSIGRNL